MTTETFSPLVRFTELEAAIRYHKAQLAALENEQKAIELLLLGEWERIGQGSARINGFTVYIHRQLWAGTAEGKSGSDVAEALRDMGLGHLATANWQSLSAWVRELAQNEESLPPALEGVVAVTERFGLRTRKG